MEEYTQPQRRFFFLFFIGPRQELVARSLTTRPAGQPVPVTMHHMHAAAAVHALLISTSMRM